MKGQFRKTNAYWSVRMNENRGISESNATTNVSDEVQWNHMETQNLSEINPPQQGQKKFMNHTLEGASKKKLGS